MHLKRYLRYWARLRPNAAALTFGRETLTWREFDGRSDAVAAELAQLNLTEGDRLGCLLPNCLEWCVAFAASAKLGLIFVPLNAAFGPFELGQIVANADLSAVVSTARLVTKLGAQAGPDDDGDAVSIFDLRAGGARLPWPSARADGDYELPIGGESDESVLLLSYTSGTTGVPKGVMLTHRAVEIATTGLALNYGLGCEDRILVIASLAFTGGVVSGLCTQLIIGGHAYLEQGVEPERVLDLLESRRITIFGGVPIFWERLAAAPRFAEADLSSIRAAFTGGAPVSRALLDLYHAKGVVIRQQYGCTENSGGATGPSRQDALARPEACGVPYPALDLELRDDAGKSVAPGVAGEIWLRGEQVTKGYWRSPELTAAAFEGEWYKTGDMGVIDPHGGLIVLDRKKNMVISGGVNIYPAEVERAIATIEGVREVAAFGIRDGDWGEKLVAVVNGEAGLSADRLQKETRALIGSYKAPKEFRVCASPLPRTATGKLQRTALPAFWQEL